MCIFAFLFHSVLFHFRFMLCCRFWRRKMNIIIMFTTGVQLSSGDCISCTKSRRFDVIRRVSAAVAARLVAVQPSSRHPAPWGTSPIDLQRQTAAADDDLGGGGGTGVDGRQRRRGCAADTGHPSSASDSPRLYDHQV